MSAPERPSLPAIHDTQRPAARSRIRQALLLAGVCTLSLAARLVGLGWGMPDYTPALMAHTEYRTSYHIDEDNFLWGLLQMHPAAGDFDVKDYHWGTLQFYAIFGVLEVAERAGLVPGPWQTAFRQGDVAALPRLYLLGRLVSVAAGLAATLAVAALAGALAGWGASLIAGLAYAVAPLAVVEAHYLTNDVTMSALVAGAVLAAVAAVGRGRTRGLVVAGLLLGLAIAAKYSAGFAAPALLVAQGALWRDSRGRRPGKRALLAGAPWLAAVAGFLLAEPYALLAPQSVIQGLRDTTGGNLADPAAGLSAPLGMLRWDVVNLAAFGLTWPLALLAAGGLAVLLSRLVGRRRAAGPADRPRAAQYAVLLAAIGGLTAGLLLNRVFVLRYTQPLIPLLAVAAGLGWAAIPGLGWRALAGSVALLGAAVITGGQLALLSAPHPANALLAWLNGRLRPGQQVAYCWPEYTLLDRDRYVLMRMDPWQPALPAGAGPDYIVMDDMQLGPPAAALVGLLARDYRPVARFAARPQLGPFAWDEGTTPHDWKYSHPTFVVYARRPVTATGPHRAEVAP